jgi:hypothetical protein
MGFFYLDESIHPAGGFILGAFVFSNDDPSRDIRDALSNAGLRPGIDEFKSGAHVMRNPAQASAREELRGILLGCGIGVVVGPEHARDEFGQEALRGLKKILLTTEFRDSRHEVFVDDGIVVNRRAWDQSLVELNLLDHCLFHIDQDSTQIMGLQLADLAAHTCATILLAELGLVTKQVRAGDNSGYDPDLKIDLAFELWAGLRRSFFAAPPPHPDTWHSQLDWQADVASRGLHIADACGQQLRDAASARFGKMYLGCIH